MRLMAGGLENVAFNQLTEILGGKNEVFGELGALVGGVETNTGPESVSRIDVQLRGTLVCASHRRALLFGLLRLSKGTARAVGTAARVNLGELIASAMLGRGHHTGRADG